MPFCANCGAPVDGQFCGKCGAPVASGAAPGQGAGRPTDSAPVSTTGLAENVAAALCYLAGFITGIIFLALAPYNQNRTVRFHAFQSIFLCVAIIALAIALSIVSTILFAISFWLGTLFGLAHLAFALAVFVLWLYMMWTAYQNKKIVLPVIGELAEKQA